MIAQYQSDPANPLPTAALLVALDRMIRYLALTRRGALGGYRDAKQEAIASVLSAARRYDITQDQQVETSLMGDVTNTLRPVTSRAARAASVEVPLDEAPETSTPPPSMRRHDLERAIKAGKINDEELRLLSWRHLDALPWDDIGAKLGTTPDTARMRVNEIAQRLSRWASGKK